MNSTIGLCHFDVCMATSATKRSPHGRTAILKADVRRLPLQETRIGG